MKEVGFHVVLGLLCVVSCILIKSVRQELWICMRVDHHSVTLKSLIGIVKRLSAMTVWLSGLTMIRHIQTQSVVRPNVLFLLSHLLGLCN